MVRVNFSCMVRDDHQHHHHSLAVGLFACLSAVAGCSPLACAFAGTLDILSQMCHPLFLPDNVVTALSM